MRTEKSNTFFKEAEKLIPGGVNSPVRAWKAVGGIPRIMKNASGSKIWDVDGNSFVDYVGSWGPLIIGHAHPAVVEAVKNTAEKGLSFGALTEGEILLARKILSAFSSMEMLRLVNSGTEAVMSALRVARAFTGKDKIVKFDGCYHGSVDSLLVKAGSGVATFGLPDSEGVIAEVASKTLTLPYNDIEAVEQAMNTWGKEIACIIVEPVAGNMGVVPPVEGFLKRLRELCDQYEALLIFDEVITGFRLCYGGAQNLYGIEPDLTLLGKIIGGGMPIGAYGGKAEIMEMVAPKGNVYQAGTLSGNPVSVQAGLATLDILSQGGVYERLEALSRSVVDRVQEAANECNVPLTINRNGSMFTIFFTPTQVRDYETAKKSNTKAFSAFFHGMLERGIHLPPSQFEACFVSLAHTWEDIDITVKAAQESLK